MHQCSWGMDQILIPYAYKYFLCYWSLLLSTPTHPLSPSICLKMYCAQLHYLYSLIRNALYKFWIAKSANVLYSETCVREPPLRLTLNSPGMYLYKTTTFLHQPLKSFSKVAFLHRFHCTRITNNAHWTAQLIRAVGFSHTATQMSLN